MDQTRLAAAGSFCWNPECLEYAQVGHDNIRKFGQTARGVQAASYGQPRWQARTPAMAAGLTDHVWTIKELLTTVVIPTAINTE